MRWHWSMAGVGALWGIGFIAILAYIYAIRPAPLPAAAICPPEPPDAWIQRRMGYCASTCVAMPFDVDVSEKNARCICFRITDKIRR